LELPKEAFFFQPKKPESVPKISEADPQKAISGKSFEIEKARKAATVKISPPTRGSLKVKAPATNTRVANITPRKLACESPPRAPSLKIMNCSITRMLNPIPIVPNESFIRVPSGNFE
jgi:hypothetical protein